MRLAARFQPCQQLGGAVDGGAFLVAGDQQADRAFGRAIRQHPFDRGDKGGDAPISCRRRRGHTARRPRSSAAKGSCFQPSPGGTTSVWPAKQKCGAAVAQPGIEIFHRRRAAFLEAQAMAGEAQGLQRRFQHIQRAGIRRRHRGAADQLLGEGNRVDHVISPQQFVDRGLGAGLLVHPFDDHGAVK